MGDLNKMSCPLMQCDDQSTDADEQSAFACLLSPHHSSLEGDSVDDIEAKSATSNSDKGIMVCRHWKSKGWCRMESNCKFLHPEEKRGDSIPDCANGGISGIAFPIISSIGAEWESNSACVVRRRK